MQPDHLRLLQRHHEEGYAHFLTFSCRHRWQLLSKDRSRLWFIDSLNRSMQKHRIACWAYVIMPEHVHLLVYPLPGVTKKQFSSWVASLKLGVTRKAIHYLESHQPLFLNKLLDVQPNGEKHYRFWQPGGGHDTNLWTERIIWDKIDYIHLNPLRRGPRNQA